MCICSRKPSWKHTHRHTKEKQKKNIRTKENEGKWKGELKGRKKINAYLQSARIRTGIHTTLETERGKKREHAQTRMTGQHRNVKQQNRADVFFLGGGSFVSLCREITCAAAAHAEPEKGRKNRVKKPWTLNKGLYAGVED